jgi:hypothetical protein
VPKDQILSLQMGSGSAGRPRAVAPRDRVARQLTGSRRRKSSSVPPIVAEGSPARGETTQAALRHDKFPPRCRLGGMVPFPKRTAPINEVFLSIVEIAALARAHKNS